MLTHESLLWIATYDPNTGLFTWRNPPYHKSKRGKLMGRLNADGYIQIKINNEVFAAAQLAWFYMTGEWPVRMVDHKNRVRNDNCWDNLRVANHFQNSGNTALSCKNKSGYKGVSRANKKTLWRASIKETGKTRRLGDFRSREAAAIAYDLAASKHFGEFAVLNFPTSPKRDWILL